ncbi:hypothetical protein HPP92_001857 [Vanilla planifolia]|uniref:RRM domain-containing protein n=1 Tax=Vanilla planifolia TaxID=51239 RepID=A0A835RRV4_VANPL|nr:hypothetical protein HPP92_001857 [Vanilla planifolia]
MAAPDIEYRLFVGGLAWATDEKTLEEAFRTFGEVIDSKIINDRETGRSRGFGFVTFANEQAMRTPSRGWTVRSWTEGTSPLTRLSPVVVVVVVVVVTEEEAAAATEVVRVDTEVDPAEVTAAVAEDTAVEVAAAMEVDLATRAAVGIPTATGGTNGC